MPASVLVRFKCMQAARQAESAARKEAKEFAKASEREHAAIERIERGVFAGEVSKHAQPPAGLWTDR